MTTVALAFVFIFCAVLFGGAAALAAYMINEALKQRP